MQVVKRVLAIVLCVLIAAPAGAQQRRVLPPGAIDQALTEHAADVAAQRASVRNALQQPDVQRVANRLGVDVARVNAAVATLDGAELDRIAAQAQLVNDEIAGGQTVRLNLLWVIIGLLVLLIILVAD